MSHKSTPSSRDTPKATRCLDATPNRRKYSIMQKRKYLREYEKVKSAGSISKFCNKHNIRRRTFRNWQDNEATIMDSRLDTRLSTFKCRDSTRPELDALLFDWFCDYRKRFPSLPINRQLLLSKAAEFQKLLDAPQHILDGNDTHSQHTEQILPSTPPYSSAESDSESEEFEMTTGMYVEDDLSNETVSTLPTQEHTEDTQPKQTPTMRFHGISNPRTRCFMNAVMQQVFLLHLLPEDVLQSVEDTPKTLSQTLRKDLQVLFDQLSVLNPQDINGDTGNLLKHMRTPTGKKYLEGIQYDAQEFFDHLISGLDSDDFLQRNVEPIRDQLSCFMVDQRICPEGHVESFDENHLTLDLTIRGHSTLRAFLDSLRYGSIMPVHACPICKKSYTHESIQRKLFVTLPKTIIVNIKRYTHGLGRTSKNTGQVTFPDTEAIDLREYTLDYIQREESQFTGSALFKHIWNERHRVVYKPPPPLSPGTQQIVIDDEGTREESIPVTESHANVEEVEEEQVSGHPTQVDHEGADETIEQTEEVASTPYLLQGVVSQVGSLSSGHYVSFVRNPQLPSEWLLFSDREIISIHSNNLPDDVFGTNDKISRSARAELRTAYMLFYKPVSSTTSMDMQTNPQNMSASPSVDQQIATPPSSSSHPIEVSSPTEIPEAPTLQTEAARESNTGTTSSQHPPSAGKNEGDHETEHNESNADTDDEVGETLSNWLTGFIRRHGIHSKNMHGEAAACDNKIKRDWLETTFREVLRKYPPEDIWNADECGLFYQQISRKTYTLGADTPSGGKINKQRVSILLACSLSANKRRCLIISNQQYPSVIMEQPSRPYDYIVQENSWMSTNSFEMYLDSWNNELKDRHIALIIDGASVHKTSKQFSNIELFYLPASQTPILQPLDQGIIRSFKARYRALLFDKCFTTLQRGKQSRWRLTNYIALMCMAWKQVTRETVSKCFKQAGWIVPEYAPNGTVLVGLEHPAEDTPVLETEESEQINNEAQTHKDIEEACNHIEIGLSKLHHLMRQNSSGVPVTTERSSDTEDKTEDSEKDEAIVESFDENEFAIEPFERTVSTRINRLLHLELELPETTDPSSEYTGSASSDDFIDFSGIKRYAERLPPGSRQDLIYRLIQSIQQDLGQEEKQPTSPKKSIQLKLSLKAKPEDEAT